MRPEDVRALALMLPGVEEGAHMGQPDFRIGGRIFATLWVDEERVVLKFPAEHQGFCGRGRAGPVRSCPRRLGTAWLDQPVPGWGR